MRSTATTASVQVSVRVQGEPATMYKVAGPLLARQVRRSVANDLRTLKALMEATSRVGDCGQSSLPESSSPPLPSPASSSALLPVTVKPSSSWTSTTLPSSRRTSTS